MGLIPKPILTSLIVILLVGVTPMPMQAQNVYVDGCATGPGNGSRSAPYKTLTRAVTEAASGSTLIVQSGIYPERLTIQKKLTITASGGSVVVGGEYFVGSQEVCVPVIVDDGLEGDPLGTCTSRLGTRRVNAKVYYPAKDLGGAQIACGGPFPAVVYAHGYRMSSWALCLGWSDPGPIHEDYRQAEGILSRLAAAGIIVISVDNSWGGVEPRDRGTIVINTIAYLRNETEEGSGSWLEGAVDLGRVGLAGHSLGGMAAIWAAVDIHDNPDFAQLDLGDVHIRALALIAPGWDPDWHPLPPQDAATLVIQGTNDFPDNVRNNPIILYGEANPPKHLVMVTEANHFGYTDEICIADDNPSEVGDATGQEAHRRQQRAARNYVHAFFSYYLLGDTAKLDYLVQESGEQCDNPGDSPTTCGSPRRRFSDLDNLSVQVSVCSCVPSTIRSNFSGPSVYKPQVQ